MMFLRAFLHLDAGLSNGHAIPRFEHLRRLGA
jgi:hypothetical protein